MPSKIVKAEPIKKRMGAPFKEVKRDVVQTLKITPNEALKLQEMAQKQGVSKSEVIRIKLFK